MEPLLALHKGLCSPPPAPQDWEASNPSWLKPYGLTTHLVLPQHAQPWEVSSLHTLCSQGPPTAWASF